MNRDQILSALRERILAFATSRVSRDHAEDLTQDTMAVLHEKYPLVSELTELVPLAFHLLFPIPVEEQLSAKLLAHQRRTIPVAAGYGAIILRFSRLPFDSSAKQAIVLSGRSSLGQLQESVTTDEASGSHEQTTYVVNQDLSVPELLVRIPIGKP